ncbi:M56 family metallopeptidase [Flavobacterium sp.]|uniref:M56 family metallopeptidase n=1 Tax=Flavobacterium sp. TaxID=239 RepID=UPI003F6A2E39
MEAFFIYFLKANGLLITFYLAYYFLLRKETFFNKNRWFLLSGLLISILLPLITYTKIVWITPNPIQILEPNFTETLPNIILAPVEEPLNWNLILMYVYFAVSGVLLLKIGVEIASFFKIIRLGFKEKGKKSIIVNHPKAENPFSFFNYIVVNRNYFNDEELDHIITHENIHVTENHSVDVLISKLFCALFWINPMVWFYRKQMLQNLEFIADNKAVTLAENKINYQKTLLKVVSNQHQLTITNQFYQSLIKKRIVMLNTNPSHQKKSWKYALILPILSAFMLLFQVETVAQVKEKKVNNSEIKIDTIKWSKNFKNEYYSPMNNNSVYAVSSNFSSRVTKNTTDEELKELEKTFSNEKRKLIISDVKRNKNKEIIEIKLVFDSGKTYDQILERKSLEPINDIKIYVNSDKNDSISFGLIEVDNEAVYPVEVLDENVFQIDKINKEENNTTWTIDNMTKNGKEVILIINGKINRKNKKVKIPMDEELGDMRKISHEEFEIKYKEKADSNKYYYEVETVKEKIVMVSWDEAKKISESEKKEKNCLYIINGKEYMQNEIPKGTTVEVDGSITELSKEEGIKKYGQKAKDGVLIFEGKSTIINKGEGKSEKKIIKISGGSWKDVENELNKNEQNKKEQLIEERRKIIEEKTKANEIRKNEREQLIEERRKLIEEKKKAIEIKRKELEEKRNN